MIIRLTTFVNIFGETNEPVIFNLLAERILHLEELFSLCALKVFLLNLESDSFNVFEVMLKIRRFLNSEDFYTIKITVKTNHSFVHVFSFSQKLGHLLRVSASRYFWWLAFQYQPNNTTFLKILVKNINLTLCGFNKSVLGVCFKNIN